MAIRFKCSCGMDIAVKDELAGRQGKCPSCKKVLTVPMASQPAPAPVQAKPTPVAAKPKKVEEEIVEADVMDDEEEIVEPDTVEDDAMEVEVDEDDAPKKKKKKPARDEDEEEEDERPKSKKKSAKKSARDEEEEEEDERPAKKKSAKSKKRDEDEEEEPADAEMEEEDPTSKKGYRKRRRAACRRADLGVFLNYIGSLVYGGGIAFGTLSLVIAVLAAKMGMGEGGGGFFNVLGILSAIAVIGGLATCVVGLGFCVMVPWKGAELGMGIAAAGCGLLSFIFMLVVMFKLFDGGGAAGLLLPFFALNPFSGVKAEGNPLLYFMAEHIGAMVYILPIMEYGRLTCFGLLQWAIGDAQKDKELCSSWIMTSIIVPSSMLVASLLFMILTMVLKPTSLGAAKAFLTMEFLVLGLPLAGMMGYYAFMMMKTRDTLYDAS